jgi:hypothetical protein
MVMLKVYKLYPDVHIPKHATVQAACFDVQNVRWD